MPAKENMTTHTDASLLRLCAALEYDAQCNLAGTAALYVRLAAAARESVALRADVARLREAVAAAERSLAYWAAKPEGQRWLHPEHGYQDPNGTNSALEATREALAATEPKR